MYYENGVAKIYGQQMSRGEMGDEAVAKTLK